MLVLSPSLIIATSCYNYPPYSVSSMNSPSHSFFKLLQTFFFFPPLLSLVPSPHLSPFLSVSFPSSFHLSHPFSSLRLSRSLTISPLSLSLPPYILALFVIFSAFLPLPSFSSLLPILVPVDKPVIGPYVERTTLRSRTRGAMYGHGNSPKDKSQTDRTVMRSDSLSEWLSASQSWTSEVKSLTQS